MNESTLGKPSELASPPGSPWALRDPRATRVNPVPDPGPDTWEDQPLEQLELEPELEPELAGAERLSRYKLREKAEELLPGHRVGYCHKKIMFGRNSVDVYRDGEKTWFSGVHKCGSVWVCPVCSPRISERRRAELQTGINNCTHRGGGTLLLTSTTSHGYADTLDETTSRFLKAQRSLKAGKDWQRVKKRYGIVGGIKSFEVTHGQNGWHPHTHELIFTRRPLSEEQREQFQAEVFALWRSRCERQGLGLPNEAHGVNVIGASGAANYVGKWGFASEMVRARSKRSQGAGRNPWELLHDAARGDRRAGALFAEYAKAFHGRQQLHWSKGLREQLLDDPKLFSDQELAELEPRTREHVVKIDADTWALVVRCGYQGDVLERAQDGRYAVFDFLNWLRKHAPLWNGVMLGARSDWR